MYLAARVKGNAASFEPVLRQVAADLSPTLRLNGLQRLDQATSGDARIWRVLANVIVGVSAITLFLSLAGIYAVVSFTVTRRTREIAVRVALGAERRAILVHILRKPLLHAAAGAMLGCLPLGGMVALSMRGANAGLGTVTERVALLLGYAVVMTGVCALACVAPAMRALRVEPTQALRDGE
jgi:ABC-type antimicrobial peptide transport system permease subunit